MNEKYSFNYNKFLFISGIVLLYILISFVVSTRIPELHNDSIRYKEFFDNVVKEGWVGISDWLFTLVNYSVSLITSDHKVVFFAFFLVQMLGHFLLIVSLINNEKYKDNYRLLYYFVVCLSSTWFYVSVVDGIRQGISLPYLYLAYLSFSKKSYLYFILYFVISVLFHSSSLLLLPFLVLTKLKERSLLFLVFIFSLGYLLDLNEELVRVFSEVTSIPIYNLIKNYSDGTMLFYGFDIRFFIYTLFFTIFFSLSSNYVDSRYRESFKKLTKFYNIFVIYYFICGFAAFSNRYAFVAWNFIPLLQTYLLVHTNVINKSRYSIFIYFLITALSLAIFLSNFELFIL